MYGLKSEGLGEGQERKSRKSVCKKNEGEEKLGSLGVKKRKE